MICPQPDCGLPNPPDRVRCLYCGSLLRGGPPASGIAGEPELPSALRDDYRVLGTLSPTGSETDRWLVVHRRTGEKGVAKLHRRGLPPDSRLLALLAKAEGDHLVRVRAHGVSDGVAYEVQEYLPDGSLRERLQGGPLRRDQVRRVVAELAQALCRIHAQQMRHGDLRPETVLVRSLAPLELALADFGSSSPRAATQQLAGGARSAKYAAPEALTGTLDERSDWWAVGMIALEAATGAHPFAGLDEQVIHHHLTTRPLDLRAVDDETLRTLCRGLLLRDPARRWGANEVARWLAGDAPVVPPDDADDHARAVEPYRISDAEATDAPGLAAALARHWDAAVKDLTGGQVGRWVEQVLHDYELAGRLRDITKEPGIADDLRLLRFLLVADPDLSPVWRGIPLAGDTLQDTARIAANGDERAEAWLDSLARQGVLACFAARHPELGDLDRRWRDAWKQFVRRWKAAQAAEQAWRKLPKAVAGVASAQIVSVDDLMFSAPMWLAPPVHAKVSGALLLTLQDGGYAHSLWGAVVVGRAELGGICPWYDALCDEVAGDPVGTLVAHRMLAHARDDAAMEMRRREGTDRARTRILAEAREQLSSRLRILLRIAAANPKLDRETTAQLRDAIGSLQDSCQKALGLGFADPEYRAYCGTLQKLSAHALAAQQALAQCAQVRRTSARLLRPEWLALLGGGALVVALAVPKSSVVLALLVVVACGAGYRWYRVYAAIRTARDALRSLNSFGNEMLRVEALRKAVP